MTQEFQSEVEVNYENLRGKCLIKWFCEMELREWGVKGLYFFVPDQMISTVLVDEEDNETSKEFELKDVRVEEPCKFVGICPQELFFLKGKWKVYFS